MTSPAAPFGPWSPNLDPVERTAQLRSLAALAAMTTEQQDIVSKAYDAKFNRLLEQEPP